MIASLSTTIQKFERADSLIPRTRIQVITHDDRHRGQVEDDREPGEPGRLVERRGDRREVGRALALRDESGGLHRRAVVGGEPVRHVQAEQVQEAAEVARPRDRHGDVADRVLDDEIPADDPGDELAERGVGIGVGRAGHRHHRRELGVAQRGEPTGDRGEHERDHDRGPGAEVVRAARDRRAGRGEDARADDRADAERGQVPLAQDAAKPARAALCVDVHPGEQLPHAAS